MEDRFHTPKWIGSIKKRPKVKNDMVACLQRVSSILKAAESFTVQNLLLLLSFYEIYKRCMIL